MKTYNYRQKPIKVFGVPFFDKKQVFERLPEDLRKTLNLEHLGKRCPGSRMCFRTDAEEITIKLKLETLSVDPAMSLFACQSAAVLAGERNNARFLGLVSPLDYNTLSFENKFKKEPVMEDITIFMPRNEVVSDIEITVNDGASVEECTPYRDIKPILYYGSSITEGGNCCSVFNAYNAIISNRLNIDYYNFGFSGSARAELELADYINTIDMSIFVYDYDHNAPDPEALKATHEPFFKRIREKNPELPIVMMSKPLAVYREEDRIRRDIIKETYNNAVNSGDKNVYFIDGETYYGDNERQLCSIDVWHPNDIGFLRMADVIEPVIKGILKNI